MIRIEITQFTVELELDKNKCFTLWFQIVIFNKLFLSVNIIVLLKTKHLYYFMLKGNCKLILTNMS
jgi:hypothetical protein